jgi:hypothetical protein
MSWPVPARHEWRLPYRFDSTGSSIDFAVINLAEIPDARVVRQEPTRSTPGPQDSPATPDDDAGPKIPITSERRKGLRKTATELAAWNAATPSAKRR